MTTDLVPRLVNEPGGDAGVYVGFRHQRRAIMLDLGDVSALQPAEILKISHAFISHAHIDHFYGFDLLLRLKVGRPSTVTLVGPAGFIDRVDGKLHGYTWNLVENNPLLFVVGEVDGDRLRWARFPCAQAFAREELGTESFSGIVLDEPGLQVRATILNHKIPVLAFEVEEAQRLNVDAAALRRLDLAPGPWLTHLKQMVKQGADEGLPIQTPRGEEPLGNLSRLLLRTTPGAKLAYVTDALGDKSNLKKIHALAHDADWFFCEAAFRHEDLARARDVYHLTARQAGRTARQAGARRLITFHYSRKYEGHYHELAEEAQAAFVAEGTGADHPGRGEMEQHAEPENGE